jgi:hypothetical protein
MSFHGVPARTLELGDPYHCECYKTARLLAQSLGLPKERYKVTFQSRFGKAKWLEPYTEPTLVAMAEAGTRSVDVICPGFTADCLETLEEIQDEARQAFLMAGGERQARGVGVIEAPRGTLIHHYRVDENDQVARANLIVSTTHDNHAMNIAIREVAKRYLDGQKLTEGLLNHIEVAIRAYDPCLSCATHALGQMPLDVALVDAQGVLVDVIGRLLGDFLDLVFRCLRHLLGVVEQLLDFCNVRHGTILS